MDIVKSVNLHVADNAFSRLVHCPSTRVRSNRMNRPLYTRMQSLKRYIAQALNGEQVPDHLQAQMVYRNLAQTRRLMDYENAPRRDMVRAHERETS
jgi:hypothetical protein